MKYLMLAPLALYALSGCESTSDANGPATYDRSAHVWRSSQGDVATDQVSGETVPVSQAVKREYGGETYYFANEDHAREFMAHPQKYEYKNSAQRSDYPVK